METWECAFCHAAVNVEQSSELPPFCGICGSGSFTHFLPPGPDAGPTPGMREIGQTGSERVQALELIVDGLTEDNVKLRREITAMSMCLPSHAQRLQFLADQLQVILVRLDEVEGLAQTTAASVLRNVDHTGETLTVPGVPRDLRGYAPPITTAPHSPPAAQLCNGCGKLSELGRLVRVHGGDLWRCPDCAATLEARNGKE